MSSFIKTDMDALFLFLGLPIIIGFLMVLAMLLEGVKDIIKALAERPNNPPTAQAAPPVAQVAQPQPEVAREQPAPAP